MSDARNVILRRADTDKAYRIATAIARASGDAEANFYDMASALAFCVASGLARQEMERRKALMLSFLECVERYGNAVAELHPQPVRN